MFKRHFTLLHPIAVTICISLCAITVSPRASYALDTGVETLIFAAQPDRIQQVKTGEVKQANALWWGFNEHDSTESLRAALKSGVSSLTIPNVGKPWIVGKQLNLPSDFELIFEPGAELCAKAGAFPGKTASLLNGTNISNVVIRGKGIIRMRKADYANPDLYEKAEWRMGIALRSVKNVTISDLTITETGGDGIYLGVTPDAPQYCESVAIRNVTLDNNYRQGISVISAVDLLIEDCVFTNTSGTAPAAGLDLEPNTAEYLKDIVIRNCTFENNAGGEIVVYLRKLDARVNPTPISVLFENCHIKSSPKTGIGVGSLPEYAPGGVIEFRDCLIENTQKPGAYVYEKHPDAALVRFTRCTWKNVALGDNKPGKRGLYGSVNVPIVVHNWRTQVVADTGNVEFIDCKVIDDQARPVIAGVWEPGAESLGNIRGTIYTQMPDQPKQQWPEQSSNITIQLIAE